MKVAKKEQRPPTGQGSRSGGQRPPLSGLTGPAVGRGPVLPLHSPAPPPCMASLEGVLPLLMGRGAVFTSLGAFWVFFLIHRPIFESLPYIGLPGSAVPRVWCWHHPSREPAVSSLPKVLCFFPRPTPCCRSGFVPSSLSGLSFLRE